MHSFGVPIRQDNFSPAQSPMNSAGSLKTTQNSTKKFKTFDASCDSAFGEALELKVLSRKLAEYDAATVTKSALTRA